MTRIVKTAMERRLEIILTSERLFKENGYSNTSVDAIITEIGVAKGTFYYYFKSKEKVLEAIVEHSLEQIIEMAEHIANDASKDALTKMQLLLTGSNIGGEDSKNIAEHLHLPENRELHEISNVQIVIKMSDVFAQIIEQGNTEGVFDVSYPLATAQFLLTGSQFLLDGGLFDFNQAELVERRIVMQDIVEKSLVAKTGSFDFMSMK